MKIADRINQGVERSALGRGLYPTNRNNVFIVVVALAIGVFAGLEHGLTSGIRGGLIAFICWMLVRELSPDGKLAAYAAPFVSIPFAIPSLSSLLACYGFVVIARLVNRSTGKLPGRFEIALVAALAIWLATSTEAVAVAIVLGGIACNSLSSRRSLLSAALFVTVIIVAALEGTLTAQGLAAPNDRIDQVALAAVFLAMVLLVARSAPRHLAVRADNDSGWIRGDRVRASRIIVVFALVASTIWVGPDAIYALSAASAAIVTTAVLASGYRAHRESGKLSA